MSIYLPVLSRGHWHLCSTGTLCITCCACRPHPFHVFFWHLSHVTWKHIFFEMQKIQLDWQSRSLPFLFVQVAVVFLYTFLGKGFFLGSRFYCCVVIVPALLRNRWLILRVSWATLVVLKLVTSRVFGPEAEPRWFSCLSRHSSCVLPRNYSLIFLTLVKIVNIPNFYT